MIEEDEWIVELEMIGFLAKWKVVDCYRSSEKPLNPEDFGISPVFE